MRNGGRARWPPRFVLLSTWLASSLLLLAPLSTYPLELWDESRVAVNALEMLWKGPGLITTYGFQPDLWNTKPPLLVWLITATMTAFGPSEWAVRLPSALAAAVTVGIVMWFVWRLTRTVSAAVLACILLVASRGFYGSHAAATGDYDALLTCFTTAYLCVLFFAVHRRRAPGAWILGAGLLMAAAVMTKSVAGVIPAAGMVPYMMLTRRWRRPLTSVAYLGAAAIVVLATVCFYAGREMAAPGYLHAVLHNDLAGRYLDTIGNHRQPAMYYLTVIASNFSAGPFVLLLFAGLFVATGRTRLGLVFSICTAATVLFVFTLSATKLRWYVLPAYPFLAAGTALSAHSLAAAVSELSSGQPRHSRVLRYRPAALVLAAVAVAVIAVIRHTPVATELSDPQGNYGRMFEQLHKGGIHAVTVVDGGERNSEGLSHYTPRLRFYELLWRGNAFAVQSIAPDLSTVSQRTGDVLVTCDPRYVDRLRVLAIEVPAARSGCFSGRVPRSVVNSSPVEPVNAAVRRCSSGCTE
jgi:4-amino-4-deoxy-L-arabinose transferase-like glycosyltransferase